MATVQVARGFETQYELNRTLNFQLGTYNFEDFPDIHQLGKAEHLLNDGGMLVISPTVQQLPLRGQISGDTSIVDAFGAIRSTDVIQKGGLDFGVAMRGGTSFNKQNTTNPIHDRDVKTPYHVAVVPDGWNPDGEVGLVGTGMTVAEQKHALANLVAPRSMTVGQYLAVNALRRSQGLEYLKGHTRCPHYDVVKKGQYSQYIPVASSAGTRGVEIQEFEANTRWSHAGMRLVLDIDIR